MSYTPNQPHLNGAYYGPPIPPPKHHPNHSRPGLCSRCGCCLFDLLFDCGCCLLGCVFRFLCSLLLFLSAILLILYLLLRPHSLTLHVPHASLSAFNYSSPLLSYSLSLNLSLRNPNSHLGIYYDSFEANSIFQGQRFSMSEIAPFFQPTKNTTEIGPVVFKGRGAISLGSDQVSEYDSQRNKGAFEIGVKLYLKVRFKLWVFKSGKFRPKFRCDLTVPVDASKFKPTKCYFDP